MSTSVHKYTCRNPNMKSTEYPSTILYISRKKTNIVDKSHSRFITTIGLSIWQEWVVSLYCPIDGALKKSDPMFLEHVFQISCFTKDWVDFWEKYVFTALCPEGFIAPIWPGRCTHLYSAATKKSKANQHIKMTCGAVIVSEWLIGVFYDGHFGPWKDVKRQKGTKFDSVMMYCYSELSKSVQKPYNTALDVASLIMANCTALCRFSTHIWTENRKKLKCKIFELMFAPLGTEQLSSTAYTL